MYKYMSFISKQFYTFFIITVYEGGQKSSEVNACFFEIH